MRPLLFCLALTLPLMACDSAEPDVPLLRIENVGALDFTAVTIEHAGQEVSFGVVAAGATSEYRSIDEATEAMLVLLRLGDLDRAFVPAHDGYGARLPDGRYTYEISVDAEGYVGVELERD